MGAYSGLSSTRGLVIEHSPGLKLTEGLGKTVYSTCCESDRRGVLGEAMEVREYVFLPGVSKVKGRGTRNDFSPPVASMLSDAASSSPMPSRKPDSLRPAASFDDHPTRTPPSPRTTRSSVPLEPTHLSPADPPTP